MELTTLPIVNMSNHPLRSTLDDGLPRQFVASMRTLFEIMDEPKTGSVHFADIESRWRDDESKRIPRGVVECLKKVTPPDGMLTFERFCAGLKICLLRNRSVGEGENGKPPLPAVVHRVGGTNPTKKVVPSHNVPPTIARPLVNSEDDEEDGQGPTGRPLFVSGPQRLAQATVFQPTHLSGHSVTATVRPNISHPHRALSMPLLRDGDGHTVDDLGSTAIRKVEDGVGRESVETGHRRTGIRTELRGYKSETKIPTIYDEPSNSPSRTSSRDDRTVASGARSRHGIMTVLHNWHMGMLNDAESKNRTSVRNLPPNEAHQGSPNALGRHLGPQFAFLTRELTANDAAGVVSDGDVDSRHAQELLGHPLRKGVGRRREPRRHTLANGIDYNMLKRMKQLEQEKDILLQGLEGVDKARAWYLKQIVSVHDKMKYIGQNNGHMEYSTEAHQERLNFQMAQIFEVNQHLAALVESSERGFPLHMNLAVRQPPTLKRQQRRAPEPQDESALQHLKELNHLLSQEVSRKSDRITRLEREKAALVRELFQARALPRKETDDTTLM